MEVKEHLGLFLSDKHKLTKIQISTLEQLNTIFSQYDRKTLIAVVKYQSCFNEPSSNLLQYCIDFILDNTNIINDVDIEAINMDASDVTEKRSGVVEETGDSDKIQNIYKDIGQDTRDSIIIEDSSNSADFEEKKEELNFNNNYVESRQFKVDEDENDSKNESKPCVFVTDLPSLDVPIRRSLSRKDKISKTSVDKVDGGWLTSSKVFSKQEKTELKSVSDSNMDIKSSLKQRQMQVQGSNMEPNSKSQSKTSCQSKTNADASSTSVSQSENSSSSETMLSQSLNHSTVKQQTHNLQLAVSEDVYSKWKVEHKKKLAEKYSKSLKLLRALTPNPEAEKQLRLAYQEKLRLVETGQKLPRHLKKANVTENPSHSSSVQSTELLSVSSSLLNKIQPPDTSVEKSISSGLDPDSSRLTLPGVDSILSELPEKLQPSSTDVNVPNSSFSEFVNRIVSENKVNLNTGIRSDNSPTIGGNNGLRTVSSVTSIEDIDNVVTVVNTITISPTNNTVIFSNANNITLPSTGTGWTTNSTQAQLDNQSTLTVSPTNKSVIFSTADDIALPLTVHTNSETRAQLDKQSSLTNTSTPIWNKPSVYYGTADDSIPVLPTDSVSLIDSAKCDTPSTAPGVTPIAKSGSLHTPLLGTTSLVESHFSTPAFTISSNNLTQSIVSPSQFTNSSVASGSNLSASYTTTPTRVNLTQAGTPLSGSRSTYEGYKRSVPSATVTSGGTLGPHTTRPQVLNHSLNANDSWTPASAFSTNIPLVNSHTPIPRSCDFTSGGCYTPALNSAVPLVNNQRTNSVGYNTTSLNSAVPLANNPALQPFTPRSQVSTFSGYNRPIFGITLPRSQTLNYSGYNTTPFGNVVPSVNNPPLKSEPSTYQALNYSGYNTRPLDSALPSGHYSSLNTGTPRSQGLNYSGYNTTPFGSALPSANNQRTNSVGYNTPTFGNAVPSVNNQRTNSVGYNTPTFGNAVPSVNNPPFKSEPPRNQGLNSSGYNTRPLHHTSTFNNAFPLATTPSTGSFTNPITLAPSTGNLAVSGRSYTPKTCHTTSTTVTNSNSYSTPTTGCSIVSTSLTSSVSMSKVTQRSEVLQLFPDADPKHIDELLTRFTGQTAVNNVCSTLIDNPNYPRVKRPEVIVISPSPDKNAKVETVDYYTAYLNKNSNSECFREGLDLLSDDFSMVAIRDITAVMNYYKNYYAPAHRALSLAFKTAMEKNKDPLKKLVSVEVKLMKNDKVEKVRHCRLLKSRRANRASSKPSKEFKKEIQFVASMIAKEKVDADAEMARKLNEAQYTEAGDNIECGCCYGEQPFEDMVQCYDGHLFCKSCLQSYVREAVFGSGKLDLSCMTDSCNSNFPESQLQCCLEKDVLEKYQDRVREENLNLADLENLVRCPNCEYAAIMDEGDKVFRCQNIQCLKETCRFCKEEWKDHIGIPCEELEKKDETALRKEYEEKMTAAKVRTCHKCKSQFMKEDGCNKMTCRCKATMCYICREPSINYNHFCQHPRDPGHNCKKCKACSLWSDPEEDDKRAVAEIQQEAQEIRREKGYLDDKIIGGTATEPPAKKARIK